MFVKETKGKLVPKILDFVVFGVNLRGGVLARGFGHVRLGTCLVLE